MRVVLIADTHLTHQRHRIAVPDGDILIHAGDALGHGTMEELAAFVRWFLALPHPHKVFVAGNHDWAFQRRPAEARDLLGRSVHYLQDSEVTVAGLRIYGSPWQPEFCGWAFNLPRNGWELRKKWADIPEGLDFLVTHGPPFGRCDQGYPGRLGCELLAEAVERAKPRYHVFGHIHSGYGRCNNGATEFVNAALCDEEYYPSNPPHVVEVESTVQA